MQETTQCKGRNGTLWKKVICAETLAMKPKNKNDLAKQGKK